MENKFLQSFLETGLFDIGDSDERLTYLEESIQELQNKLKETPSLLPVYTLVALDPEIPDNEPVLKETEAIVTTHWRALRVKFREMPRPILRGVILNALYNLGSADAHAARIIYLTGSNFYPYSKLSREKECVEKLLTDLGTLAEEDAVRDWALLAAAPEIKLGTLKISGLKFDGVEVATGNLKKKLKVASSRTPENYNAYQHPDQWAEHFSIHAAEGIGNVLETAFKGLSEAASTSSIETPINKFFTDFKKSLNDSLKASFGSLEAVERRSKLLWWKETLYSPSLKGSYRDLDAYMQPVVMAFDLYQQLPEITPVSVDYLLRDTLYLLNDTSAEKKTFETHLNALVRSESKMLLKGYFEEVNGSEGRIAFTDFVALLIYDKVGVGDLKRRTGIELSETISRKDLSVVILHDLMTQCLISE